MPVPPFLETPQSIYQIAEQYWDLRAYPTQYVFSLLGHVSEDKLEKTKCLELSSPEGQEDWLNYSRRPKRTILEVLHDFHRSAAKLTLPVLFELFSAIKPRSFSIASSALPSGKRELQLLVAVVKYRTKLKRERFGLASNWLKSLNAGDQVYGWIKAGSLVFPAPTTPLIMVGPGTGLAPFRSLVQERRAQGTLGRHVHLFFGCRHSDKDFHCKRELEALRDEGKMSLYCAFSRDQDRKIYVQHKMMDNSQLLHDLIMEQNAYIYVAGNAKNMPDNVKETIAEILDKVGGIDLSKGKEFLQVLEKNGRLQVEAW